MIGEPQIASFLGDIAAKEKREQLMNRFYGFIFTLENNCNDSSEGGIA
jgi:hypothetical protein